ncbi:MAG: hypothetical protein M3P70_01825 [Actinomycetota bacterium]|nr:hypothetical protein [Actinomycetota bacterium]
MILYIGHPEARSLFFEFQAPHAVEVVVGVGVEGDHRLGAGDAGDRGDPLRYYLGETLEGRDAHHDYQVS